MTCPITGPELLHWLVKGHRAFIHRGEIWLRLPQFDGPPKLFPVDQDAIEYRRDAVKVVGAVITLSDKWEKVFRS